MKIILRFYHFCAFQSFLSETRHDVCTLKGPKTIKLFIFGNISRVVLKQGGACQVFTVLQKRACAMFVCVLGKVPVPDM